MEYLKWQQKVLVTKISNGDWDSIYNSFLDAVICASKTKQLCTGALISNRRSKIKNLRPHEWKECVEVLKARGKLHTEEKNGKTIYSAIK